MLKSYDGVNLEKSNLVNVTAATVYCSWKPGDMIVRQLHPYDGTALSGDVGIIVWINRSPQPTRLCVWDMGVVWSSSSTKVMSDVENV